MESVEPMDTQLSSDEKAQKQLGEIGSVAEKTSNRLAQHRGNN
jgi:hypothetical protein